MTIIYWGRHAPRGDADRFYPLDPSLPEVTRHRPLALAVLADYGAPLSHAERVSAIMDWIARIALHGHSGLRLPTPYNAGTATLPPGENWASVQSWLSSAKQQSDNVFWGAFNHDAAAMLDVLLGTLRSDGTRAADGAMEQITLGGARALYRYRSLSRVRSVWCSWQHDIATLLLATLGYPSMLAHVTGHDPLRVQYGERAEWGYWCSTYNEHYSLTSQSRPLDLAELRDLTQAGRLAEVRRQAHIGPKWDPVPYVSASYIGDHPEGWPTWSVSLDSRIVPNGRLNRQTLPVDDSLIPFEVGVRVSEEKATPYLGAYVVGVPLPGLGTETIRIASSWPGTIKLSVQRGTGAWSLLTLGTIGVVRVFAGSGQVNVAPVDADGQRGPMITLEMAAPI